MAVLNENFLTRTAGLAQLEAGITTAEANAKINTITLNRSIAAETAKLEVLKDPVNANIDKDALNAKKEAALQKYRLANSTVMNNEGAALDADAKGIQEAIDALDRDAIDEVNNLYYGVVAFTGTEYLQWESTTGIKSDVVNLGAYISESQKLEAETSFANRVKMLQMLWVRQQILRIRILLMVVLLLLMHSWKMQIRWVKQQMQKRRLKSKL